VATATLATFAGGGGLGDIIVNEATYGSAGVIAGSLMITVLAFAVDGLLAIVQRQVTPLPLRKQGRTTYEPNIRSAGNIGLPNPESR
jgi:osmoprotectant transport system permease protein